MRAGTEGPKLKLFRGEDQVDTADDFDTDEGWFSVYITQPNGRVFVDRRPEGGLMKTKVYDSFVVRDRDTNEPVAWVQYPWDNSGKFTSWTKPAQVS